MRLEAINERVQAEGAYFGEDKLVRHFVRRVQQPFQDKLIPYPRTLDEAVEKLTALEEAAAKFSTMKRKSGVAAFAITTEGNCANPPQNVGIRPMVCIEKRVDHGDRRVTIHLVREDGTKFMNYYIKRKAVCQHYHETGHTVPARRKANLQQCVPNARDTGIVPISALGAKPSLVYPSRRQMRV